MKKIWFIGDLHLSNVQKWSSQLNSKIINYLLEKDWGKPEDTEIIQLGDVVERALNYGSVTKDVYSLFASLRPKVNKLYVISGNHDQKFTSNGTENFLDFLEDLDIDVIKKEMEITTPNGFKFLALPHQRDLNLYKKYNENLDPNFYSNSYDFIAGHLQIINPDMTFIPGLDMSKFNCKKFIMGHIHTRTGKNSECYTGSIAPFKITEYESSPPRSIFSIDKTKNTIIEEPLPNFIQYEVVKYKDAIPEEQDDLIHLYRIKDAPNIEEARSYYPDKNIVSIERVVTSDNLKVTYENNLKTNKEYLTELSGKMQIKRKTYEFIKSLL